MTTTKKGWKFGSASPASLDMAALQNVYAVEVKMVVKSKDAGTLLGYVFDDKFQGRPQIRDFIDLSSASGSPGRA